ncbi:MAG: hypothetical protein R3C03_09605 [Pirellulaceae bacterium]
MLLPRRRDSRVSRWWHVEINVRYSTSILLKIPRTSFVLRGICVNALIPHWTGVDAISRKPIFMHWVENQELELKR